MSEEINEELKDLEMKNAKFSAVKIEKKRRIQYKWKKII